MNAPAAYGRSGGQELSLALGAAVLCGLLGLAGAQAAQPDERLEEVERALEENQSQSQDLERTASDLQAEIETLQTESVKAAQKTQDLESHVSRIEEALGYLQARYHAKEQELEAQHGQLYHTLAALQRIAVQPTEAVLVGRGTPIERVRSALLLKAAIPAIEDRAAELRTDLQALSTLRAEIGKQRGDLTETARALAEERESLSELIGRKKSLRAQTLEERSRAEERALRLAAEAQTLRELLTRLDEESRARDDRAARDLAARQARLDAERAAREAREAVQAEDTARAAEAGESAPAAPPADSAQADPAAEGGETQLAALPPEALARPANVRPFPSAPIQVLVMPVRGRLVLSYGQRASGADAASQGITINTRSQAQVVAPFDGQVVYAGKFRGYGQILIIEHGGRYHTLLAGLERIDAVVGQWILAGEPIGMMGSPDGQTPELYLELRRSGQPVNPLPWLATTDTKVQG